MTTTATHPVGAIYERPAALLRTLLRFDTTNPPGNEAACVAYIDGLLQEAGIETRILAKHPDRPNLVARLPGRGDAPPLLLHGHVDVVTTAEQPWTHPPFEGALIDGEVWGRGALDMKSGVAMMVAAFLRARVEDLSLPGDVVLMIFSDEENGSDVGAKFLTEEHPELFAGMTYAIGEGGGRAHYVAGRRFYPVMVAEKQICWLRGTLSGPAGHGSRPLRGGAMGKLGRLLTTLDARRLPVHITPVAAAMLASLREAVPGAEGEEFARLADPELTDPTLDAMGARGLFFDPMLHNTVNATIVQGGHKINVIPSEVHVELDGRLLPGQCADDLIRELRELLGEGVAWEVIRNDPSGHVPNLGLYPALDAALRAEDHDAAPMPYQMFAVTDGRFLERLGIQPYGYLPLDTPPGTDYTRLVHAADERVPARSVEFGARVLYRLLGSFTA